MILFIVATIVGSSYFTYGDLSDNTKSYSIAGYGYTNYEKNHILFAYDNYMENWNTGSIRQHLVSLGYAREIKYKIGVRSMGFYIFDSMENLSAILSNRILYGYTTVFTLGYAISMYSNKFTDDVKYYSQITPDVRILIGKKIWLEPGLCYTTGNENYLSLITRCSIYFTNSFSMNVSGMYGKNFYYVDDKLLVINNRPDVLERKLSIQFNHKAMQRLKLSVARVFSSFSSYDVNYWVGGIECII